MSFFDHAVYAVLWLIFGWTHSVLARSSIKDRLQPFLGKTYRLAYNLFALAHFLLTVTIGRQLLSHSDDMLVQSSVWGLVLSTIMWTGIVLIVVALLHYDLGQFSGLKQVRTTLEKHLTDDGEPLHRTGLHQYVRHPLYLGLFLFFWGSVQSEFTAATAVWATLYTLIGTYFEERSLIARYGEEYETYRRRVPAFFPWKGRQI